LRANIYSTHEAVVVDGVDVLLLGDHVSEAAAARRVLEGDAVGLAPQDPVDVIAVVQVSQEKPGGTWPGKGGGGGGGAWKWARFLGPKGTRQACISACMLAECHVRHSKEARRDLALIRRPEPTIKKEKDKARSEMITEL